MHNLYEWKLLDVQSASLRINFTNRCYLTRMTSKCSEKNVEPCDIIFVTVQAIITVCIWCLVNLAYAETGAILFRLFPTFTSAILPSSNFCLFLHVFQFNHSSVFLSILSFKSSFSSIIFPWSFFCPFTCDFRTMLHGELRRKILPQEDDDLNKAMFRIPLDSLAQVLR